MGPAAEKDREPAVDRFVRGILRKQSVHVSEAERSVQDGEYSCKQSQRYLGARSLRICNRAYAVCIEFFVRRATNAESEEGE